MSVNIIVRYNCLPDAGKYWVGKTYKIRTQDNLIADKDGWMAPYKIKSIVADLM